MTHPTNDPMADSPPAYNEGPPEDKTEIARARRHIDRLAGQNEPAGDTAGMRGQVYDTGDHPVAAPEDDSSQDGDA